MKAVILAGGMGTRIVEESYLKPKPMIEIGEHPILWHIMKIYSCQGVDEFVVCLGYKSSVIKDFFLNYQFYNSDFTGDVDAEWQLDKQNRFRLKGFTHSADQFTDQLDNSQRSGVGIIYQEDFNTFGELLKRWRELLFGKKKPKE